MQEFSGFWTSSKKGGQCLGAYPRYQKVVEQGAPTGSRTPNWRGCTAWASALSPAIRRSSIVYTNRRVIGTVEENFVSRLKPGDVFFFAGRQLEFFQMKDMVVYVKNTRRQSTVTPSTWGGGQLAISDTLSTHLRQEVERVRQPEDWSREVHCIAPILETQTRLSHAACSG
jgi:ATP-dependent Lhr-like helicase